MPPGPGGVGASAAEGAADADAGTGSWRLQKAGDCSQLERSERHPQRTVACKRCRARGACQRNKEVGGPSSWFYSTCQGNALPQGRSHNLSVCTTTSDCELSAARWQPASEPQACCAAIGTAGRLTSTCDVRCTKTCASASSGCCLNRAHSAELMTSRTCKADSHVGPCRDDLLQGR